MSKRKLTKSQLRKVIREEVAKVLREATGESDDLISAADHCQALMDEKDMDKELAARASAKKYEVSVKDVKNKVG